MISSDLAEVESQRCFLDCPALNERALCLRWCLLSYVMMMPFKRQALVEFSELQSADRCVSCGAKEPVYIAGTAERRLVRTCAAEGFLRAVLRPTGQQAYFNYSTSKRITRPTNADNPNSGNKVLLLSIQNPLYPITTVNMATPPVALMGAHVRAHTMI